MNIKKKVEACRILLVKYLLVNYNLTIDLIESKDYTIIRSSKERKKNGADNLGNDFESKVDKDLTELAQERWKEIVEETHMVELDLGFDMIVILRQYFQLAYQQGYNDLLAQMQDIYDNDVDLFVTMFEKDNLN